MNIAVVNRRYRKTGKTPVLLVSFLIKLQASGCNFIKKETLAQVSSCEFCEISKSTFFYRTPPVAASAYGTSFFVLR